jgi:atypical dual specificity phosphatase
MTKYIHTLNWSLIQPTLYVGSCPLTSNDVHTICNEVKPDTILSLQTIECHKIHNINHEDIINTIQKHNVEYLWCPMLDFNSNDQQFRLPSAVKMLDVALNRGIVYVHCTAGINRAPLVVLAYLVFIKDETLDDALTFIQKKRPEVYPYIDAFLGCRSDITTKNKPLRAKLKALDQRKPAAAPPARRRHSSSARHRAAGRGSTPRAPASSGSTK